jgi:Ras-related protein Rab-4B
MTFSSKYAACHRRILPEREKEKKEKNVFFFPLSLTITTTRAQFIVIGDAAVGKSCVLARFVDDKFKHESTHTIGVEFGSKILEVGGKQIKLQIWDTAGQERFRSVTRSYYRGAAGCILVYDVTSRESYNHVSSWLADARSLASPELTLIMVGNKIDLSEDREVTFLEASRFAQENDLMFLETSAMTGEGVSEVFLKCARTILSKIDDGTIDPDTMGSGVQRGDARRTSAAAGQSDGCAC